MGDPPQQNDERGRILHDLYYSLENPTAFTSAKRIKEEVRRKGLNIAPDFIDKWFQSQETYGRHFPARVKFPKNFYNVVGIDFLWEADLNDMRSLASHNKPYKYILTVICCFSRFAWAVPLQTKSASEVASALENIFTSSKRVPKVLQVDKGTEFKGAVQDVLKRFNVRYRTTENRGKAAIVEKFNQNLKSRMYKYFTFKSTWHWVDILPKILKAYNASIHSTLNQTPQSVTKMDEYRIWSTNYKRHVPQNNMKQRSKSHHRFLNVGDFCRVSLVKQESFEKGYTPRFSQSVYKIRSILPMRPVSMYILEDLNGEVLKGQFYPNELLKIAPPTKENVYKVERILKYRRRAGCEKEALVRWEGYDKHFDSWEPVSAIKSLNH